MARVASLGALLGHANDVMDLGRPTYEEVAQVGPHALRLLLTRLGVGRAREEGVPRSRLGSGLGLGSGSGPGLGLGGSGARRASSSSGPLTTPSSCARRCSE